MASRPKSSDGFDALLTQIVSILAEESIAPALAGAARLIAKLTAADAAALFAIEGGELTVAGWYPAETRVKDELRTEMRGAAQAAARRGAAGEAETADAGARRVLRTLPLVAGGRLLGIACLTVTRKRGASRPLEHPWLAPVLAVFTPRLASHREHARADVVRGEYERWFKTLDEQVRVLDRERQKFAAIVHQSDTHVFVADAAGTVSWTNSALAAAGSGTGEPSSWIGLPCGAVCARFGDQDGPDGCEPCAVRRALQHNEVAHHELRRTESGAVRNQYLTALPIKGPDGRPKEVMVMIQDLSDLDVLRHSESRYRLLFERNGKAIVMVDPVTRRIVLANPVAERLMGCGRAELIGMPLEHLHAPKEWRRLEALYAIGFAEKTLAGVECLIRPRAGAERIATVSGTPSDLDGREVIMLEYQDVTERRIVEAALRSAEERLHAVVSNAPVVLFAIDRDGTFSISEGRGLASLGLKPGEIVGQSVYEVYRDAPAVIECVQRALAGEEFTTVVDVGGLAFETRYSPVRDDAGKVTGLIGVATEVTERRRLEEKLRQSQKMEAIGRLAGGVAHDFNNMLAAILGHSELMLSRVEPGETVHRYAAEIQKAAVRGAMLTRQLLSFSRKEVIAPHVLDVNLVVAEMEGMLRRLIGEDIEFGTTLTGTPLRVRCDHGHLEQVVLNLVVNARDALPRGGRLMIVVGAVEIDAAEAQRYPDVRPGPHVLVSVSDNGCGMDAQTLAHVFEPFYTTKAQGQGTGLGLSTVYAIVEQCGGHIRVHSEPAAGSTFSVFLPREDGTPAAVEADPAPGGVANGAETVLLVEDEDAVRAVAREVLESCGYRVTEARHGKEALEIAERNAAAFDLLVTDVVMPHLGGSDLAERLTRLNPMLRVLFMSGYTDDAIIKHGVREERTAFLQKPFAIDAFARKVREVLDGSPDGAPSAAPRAIPPPRA